MFLDEFQIGNYVHRTPIFGPQNGPKCIFCIFGTEIALSIIQVSRIIGAPGMN